MPTEMFAETLENLHLMRFIPKSQSYTLTLAVKTEGQQSLNKVQTYIFPHLYKFFSTKVGPTPHMTNYIFSNSTLLTQKTTTGPHPELFQFSSYYWNLFS
jgi:hypothetical protein